MADTQYDVVEQEEKTGAVQKPTEPDSLMGALINAAMNPDIDADKMERMLSMYERMESRKAKVEFDEALAKMLPEIPEIGKTGEANNREGDRLYKFAKWDQMNRVIKPILQTHGFALTFRTQEHEKGVLVTGVLSRGGHSETTSLLQSLESASSAMNANQARGNAVSYGKRYTAAALLNIITTDENDNDNQTPKETIVKEEADEINRLLKLLGGSHLTLLEWVKSAKGFEAASVDDLPAELAEIVKKQLRHWMKQRGIEDPQEQSNAG